MVVGCYLLPKVSSPRCVGDNLRSNLGIDRPQNLHAVSICKNHVGNVERNLLVDEARGRLFPYTAKFDRPWPRNPPFQRDYRCFFGLVNCDSQRTLALPVPRTL